MDIDIEAFKKGLYEESFRVFPQIIEKYKHEGIYSLAYYTSGDSWSYLSPTVATLKGLEASVQESLAFIDDEDLNLEDHTLELKWSPADSPYHDDYELAFPVTLEALNAVSEKLYGLGYQAENEIKTIQTQMLTACMEVLSALDRDGIFSGIDRKSFTLNILNGDQSYEERLERAQQLNPPAVITHFSDEIQRCINYVEREQEKMRALLDRAMDEVSLEQADMKIDIEHFKNTLYKEAAELFPKIIQQYKHEGIYSIAFYTNGDFTYLLPTFSTYKGLNRMVSAYQEHEWYENETVEELTQTLKWSPCDSPYHGAIGFGFDNTSNFLNQFSEAQDIIFEQTYQVYEGSDSRDMSLTDTIEQLRKASLDTLIKLDNDGIFAELERDTFVLNLLMGDEDYRDCLENAAKVNPPSALKTCQQDLQPILEKYKQVDEEIAAMLKGLSKTKH